MWATLVAVVAEFTRPMYSSISFGLLPADVMRVGFAISVGSDMQIGFILAHCQFRGLGDTRTRRIWERHVLTCLH